jgi:hypothetical protein
MLLDPDGAREMGAPASSGQTGRMPAVRSATIRDLPSGAALLGLGREHLLEHVLPLLPPERHRELRLVATAMAIAAREAEAGDAPAGEIAGLLRDLYRPRASRPQSGPNAGDPEDDLCRFAADLRIGAFDRCDSRVRIARAILWRLTILKLREGNPGFLAENGFGE